MIEVLKDKQALLPEGIVLPPSHDIQLFGQLMQASKQPLKASPDFSQLMAEHIRAALPTNLNPVFSAVFIMPNLGQIRLKGQNGTIEIRADNKLATAKLNQHKDKIAGALNESFSSPVRLEITPQ